MNSEIRKMFDRLGFGEGPDKGDPAIVKVLLCHVVSGYSHGKTEYHPAVQMGDCLIAEKTADVTGYLRISSSNLREGKKLLVHQLLMELNMEKAAFDEGNKGEQRVFTLVSPKKVPPYRSHCDGVSVG